jgi:hypothetical protein
MSIGARISQLARLYGIAILIAIGLMLLISAIATLPHFGFLWTAFLPGAFVAALVFPDGVNSGGFGFLFLAGIADAMLFALPVLVCIGRCRLIVRKPR